jgi:D-alanyl-lipoteichoic acid acyltransferase DltB (MBOAT superfamily)
MATFVIGGIWHGAGWTFVFWGFLHGAALAVQKLWSKLGFKLWTWLAWFITFNFVNITWVFFRAKEWDDAVKVLSSMFSLGGLELSFNYLQAMIMLSGFAIVLLFKNSAYFYESKFKFSTIEILIFVSLMIVSILAIKLGDTSEFLYFNF